jgi:hypothetical protein
MVPNVKLEQQPGEKGMAEERKSWWQTAAGVMTGVAALITAFTGLIVALHQIRKGDSEGGKLPEQSASTHAPSSGDDSKTRKGVEQSVSTHTPPSKVGFPKGGEQRLSTAPAVNRPAHALSLPTKHEFVLGSGGQTGRFILTSARLEPHTTESDLLKIAVQVVVDGQQQYPFNNMQFELRIDEQPYKSTTYFNEYIPAGQSRDHAVHFTIPHGPTRAVLWIHEWLSNAEIPLDLTAPE